MKKLSLLLAALIVAFGASATMQMKHDSSKHGMKMLNHRSLVKTDRQRMADVVTEQPEGSLVKLKRGNTGGYMASSSSSISVGNQSGSVMAVISDDGKTMWIRDILAGVKTGAWVKGELTNDGTVLIVDLDQTIYSGSYENEAGEIIPYDVKLCWGSTSVEGDYIYFDFDWRTTQAEFSIEGDVITMLYSEGVTEVDPYEDASYVATGLTCYYTDDDSWAGFLDWNTTLTNMGPLELPEMITEQPEGEMISYRRAGDYLALEAFWFWTFVTPGEQSGYVNVVYAPDGKTVYIQHLLSGYDEEIIAWVKGELDEQGLIHIPSGQCIYYDDSNMAALRLMMGDIEAIVDDEDFIAATPSDEEILLSVEDNVITLVGSFADIREYEDGDLYLVHGLSAFWDIDDINLGIVDWNSTFTHIIAVPAIPANPENVEWYDAHDEDGYSELNFDINLVDVDGKPIDETCLYYRIYTDDDQLFTFDAVTYEYTFAHYGVTEDLTDIPYMMQYYDLHPEDGVVYFYRTNYNDNPFFNERIGIQLVYKVDGVENVSDIVYWYRPVVQPAVPADPIVSSWTDGGDESGYSYLNFDIILEDVDGNALDEGYVYYRIYTDNDELFTFDAETYSSSGVTEDMTDMPYTMSGWDLGPEYGAIYFYRTNADGYETFFNQRIGMQIVYKVNGVENASNIVYWYLPEPPAATIPANPIGINWHDCGDESGYSYFDFQIFDRDVDGNPLDAENISYSIFVDDDQIFTFDANTYIYDLYVDMTEIPYWIWSEGYDIQSNRVYFYRTNEGDNPLFYQRIGIQVYYRVDGVLVGQSDIVYLDKDVSVNEINAGKTVANVRYFNVAGQEMAQPEGVTIQITTYTDGTTHAVKVVK